jgi:hypothetical protein
VLDPANPFVAPTSAPFIIGIAYANMVWGFANVTISTNLARDLGTRIVAAIFYGGDAFNDYAAIAILVNIPATVFATAVYEAILRDSFAIIAKGHNVRSNFLDSFQPQMQRHILYSINAGIHLSPDRVPEYCTSITATSFQSMTSADR